MEMFLGFDIGGTKCAVVLGDANGEVYEKIRFETTNFEETLEKLLEAGDKLITNDVVALGVSCGGPLDSKKGVIMSPPNLPGWDNVPIVEILEKRFERPAFLKNDADACAIAEWKWGAARGCDNAVFLTCSTGMGAGLILGGKP
ncbi:MAG: ROK family protein, partial [Clostridia bacterium]|nr:ROK family protein [Clostridia bacterium]